MAVPAQAHLPAARWAEMQAALAAQAARPAAVPVPQVLLAV